MTLYFDLGERGMVFTLGTLFEALLLLVNAIAILNEERFLAKGT